MSLNATPVCGSISLMKLRRLLTVYALYGVLLASGICASADEATRMTPLTTALSTTVASGYSNAGLSRQVPLEHRGWFAGFLFWLGFHGR